jgi:hypothetical protein
MMRVIFSLHLLIILGVLTSPFWLSWKIILIFIVLYYLQLFFFKNCILTSLQFGEVERDTTFYSYCLTKLGLKHNKKKLRLFLDYVLPWIILLVGIIFQRGLG